MQIDRESALSSEGACYLTVTATGDGAFYLRATARNGASHVRVLSVLDLRAEGFGRAYLDPYSFIAGSLNDIRLGEITPGNEQGIAFARDGLSGAGFTNVDFGLTGSDTLTLPIFALDGDLHEMSLWDGEPDKDGRLLARLPYQKPSIWNVYQAETYRLPEVLTGVHTLVFTMENKVHLKGFSFERQSRALRWNQAADADQIYGDHFRKEKGAVLEIGNNVTLVFERMWFAQRGNASLTLEGSTTLPAQAIQLRIQALSQDQPAESTMLSFPHSPSRTQHTFSIEIPPGDCTVSFVFLPGSRFDFYGFRFEADPSAD